MKRIIYIISTLSIVWFSACVGEDFFGLSPYGNIKSIEISNQAGLAHIDTEKLIVNVEMPPGVDLSELRIKTLSLSSFATSDKGIGDLLNLNADEIIKVSAENGSVIDWTIKANITSASPQLKDADFNTWYQTSGGYYEPGENAETTIWGTGNPGTQILDLLATTPIEISNDNHAVKMETLDNGPIAGAFGTPISAGSVFTGKFDKDKIDPSDPQAAINFGIPFAGRPQKMKVKYQYKPGAINKDKDGNELPEGDKCDIYAYLEIRLADKTQRLATAWFRSEAVQAELSEIELDFTYGELDNSFPDYMKPENGLYVSADSSKFVLPTHITFVASSSYNGAIFSGAIGSELIVDDVELLYNEN